MFRRSKVGNFHKFTACQNCNSSWSKGSRRTALLPCVIHVVEIWPRSVVGIFFPFGRKFTVSWCQNSCIFFAELSAKLKRSVFKKVSLAGTFFSLIFLFTDLINFIVIDLPSTNPSLSSLVFSLKPDTKTQLRRKVTPDKKLRRLKTLKGLYSANGHVQNPLFKP